MSQNEDHYKAEKEITTQVVNRFRGSWGSVMASLLPELADAIRRGSNGHVDCPLYTHTAKTSSSPTKKFRVGNTFDEDCRVFCTCTDGPSNAIVSPIALIQAVRGIEWNAARLLLMEYAGIKRGRLSNTFIAPAPKPIPRPVDPEMQRKKDERINRTKEKIAKAWAESLPLDAKEAIPARVWFKRRNLWAPAGTRMPNHLRFHPSMAYYQSDDDGKMEHVGDFPCVIAQICNKQGEVCGLNRTYMTASGQKIPGLESRKMWTPPVEGITRGAAVKLDESICGVLNVAEGIETALAVRLFTSLPTWATLTACNLENVEVPEGTKLVTIWTDKDKSERGLKAAQALVLRLRDSGIRAVAIEPFEKIPEGSKGIDWNDMLSSWGVETIRENVTFRTWWSKTEQVLAEFELDMS